MFSNFVSSWRDSSNLQQKVLTRWWLKGFSGILALLAFASMIGVLQRMGVRNDNREVTTKIFYTHEGAWI